MILEKQTYKCRTAKRRETIIKKLKKEIPIGSTYNNLTCISEPFFRIRTGDSGKLSAAAKFKCKCGNIKTMNLCNIKRKDFISCGCMNASSGHLIIKHGDSKKNNKGLYAIFNGMKQRCLVKNIEKYPNYAGKGIKICKKWEYYIDFRDWALNNGYKNGLSIDRIDSNKDYCPENCEWVTRQENAKRVTSNRDKQIKLLKEENTQLKNRILELEQKLLIN